jgi:hypothetical protein
MEMDISQRERREIITSGTYLHSYCPFCEKSLIKDDLLELTIIEKEGEVGHLLLSPYLNIFNHKSTIQIPRKSEAKDIKCPHCDNSLITDYRECHDCGARIIKFKVEAVSRMIDFYICARQGCTWHGLSHEDLDDIILEDSSEW